MIRLFTLCLSALLAWSSCQTKPQEIKIEIDSSTIPTTRAVYTSIETQSQNSTAIAIKKMSAAELPLSLQNQFNNIEQILHWEEGTDKHKSKYIAILAYMSKDSIADIQCAMYKSHAGSEYVEEWSYVSDKPLSISDSDSLEFTKNQFLITDLDNDLKPELWIGYTLQCTKSKSFKKELCLVFQNKLDRFNPIKNTFNITSHEEIIDFARTLWN